MLHTSTKLLRTTIPSHNPSTPQSQKRQCYINPHRMIVHIPGCRSHTLVSTAGLPPTHLTKVPTNSPRDRRWVPANYTPKRTQKYQCCKTNALPLIIHSRADCPHNSHVWLGAAQTPGNTQTKCESPTTITDLGSCNMSVLPTTIAA